MSYVCLCMGVTEDRIKQEISNGARSVEELSARLGVCMGCGCCRPQVEDVLSGKRVSPKWPDEPEDY